MDLCYAYLSKNPHGSVVEGMIYAPSEAEAHYRLKRKLGHVPLEIKLNAFASLRAIIRPGFDPRDLVTFYRAFGTRMEKGQSIQQGLENAIEFVSDGKLKQAIALMSQDLQEGGTLGNAMRLAGFPERDVAALESTADTGKIPDTLLALAAELQRTESLRSAIRAIVQMPLTVAFIMYCGFYAALVVFMPAMRQFYKALGKVDIPVFARALYSLSEVFSAHLTLATLAYLGALVLFVAFCRSRALRALLDRVPVIKNIAQRADLANLWTGFALLYDAGVNVEEACRMLARAASRPESRVWFDSLARQFRAGLPLVAAVQKAGFPALVVQGIRAADSSGDVVAGVNSMASRLSQDVADFTRNYEHYIRLASYLLAALGVAVFFLVTYYPILASTFAQL
jgi:type II secretory pathway component PulF